MREEHGALLHWTCKVMSKSQNRTKPTEDTYAWKWEQPKGRSQKWPQSGFAFEESKIFSPLYQDKFLGGAARMASSFGTSVPTYLRQGRIAQLPTGAVHNHYLSYYIYIFNLWIPRGLT